MNDLSTSKVVVITPVYEDLEAASELFRELRTSLGPDVYVVAVDDGSVKQPLAASDLEAADVNGAVLKLTRNMGHQRAIAVGISFASEQVAPDAAVIVMDSDGEDKPETITDLRDILNSPDVDVAVAERRSRIETLRFRVFYVVYKFLFSLLTGRKISFGNFMAVKGKVLSRLSAMQELPVHFAAAVLNSRLRIRIVPIDRGARYAGQSKMNFVGLVLHGSRGLMVFAEDVTVRVGLASVIVGAATTVIAMIVVMLKLIGLSTPGWFSVALGILFLIFLQTGALALMTLMLTGVVRGGTLATPVDHKRFIAEVLFTRSTAPKP